MKKKMKYIISLVLLLVIVVTIIVLKNNYKEKLISGTEYIEIAIEDTEAGELVLTSPVKIYDKEIIQKIEEKVNNGTEYEPRSTAWSDISPNIIFYLENGEKYSIFTDNFLEDGEEEAGNYITIFKINSNGEEDIEYNKKTYKIEADLWEYATNLYNQFK